MSDQPAERRFRRGAEPVFTVGEFVGRERAALARFAASARRSEPDSRMLLIDWQTMLDQHERRSTALPPLSLPSRLRIRVSVLVALARWHLVQRWRSDHLLLTLEAFIAVEHGRLEGLVEKASGDASRHTEDEWYHQLFSLPAGPASK